MTSALERKTVSFSQRFQEPFQLNLFVLFSRAKFLETEEKNMFFFSVTVSYRTSRLPFKAAAGAGGSIWGTPSV